mgnify:CR=1 FL=1
MTPPLKRLFPKEYSKELFRIARGDYESALGLFKVKVGRKENIAYLCQQAVEKSLKSLLISQQIAFPLVHDLGSLLSLLPDKLIPPGGFNLLDLNPYASIRRYEEGSLALLDEEIESALIATKNVLDWCEPVIHN